MGAPLWTLAKLVAAASGRLLGQPAEVISGVSIDSRSIERGEVFFAIRGDRVDGHDYVADALNHGAALAVVAEAKLSAMPAGAPLLVVSDVLDALRGLARAARARSAAQVIAVTGSAGKTGTKEALKIALSREGETHASAASHNNHWGVPLSLARLSESARFGVFELGMSHAGEMAPLVRLVRPHIAIITTVEPVHLEFFPNVEAIADAKAEIFIGLEPGGVAVLPRDNPHFERLATAARNEKVQRIVGFGTHQQAGARVLDMELKADCSAVRANILGDEIVYKIGVPGRHLVLNSLAVLAAVKLAGADLAVAALALSDLIPPPGRGRRIVLDFAPGEALLIDESYNANPASMRAALAVLGQAPVGSHGRRIAVLGDMLELGVEAEAHHRALAATIAAANVDLVFCAGPLMRQLWKDLPAACRGGYAEDASGLESEVVAAVRAGDVIMVKGSNASRIHQIAKALSERFRESAPANAEA